jgi:tetratricopeptide (TPR) repeat protein
MQQQQQQQFDSEGFDLDAPIDTTDLDGGEGVVYELGGGITTTYSASSSKKAKEDDNDASVPVVVVAPPPPPHPTDESERLKELGNIDYKRGNHLDAYDYYTEAIEACPYGEGYGPTGTELVAMQEEYDEARKERLMEKERQRREMERGKRIEKEEERRARRKEFGRNDDNDDDDKKKEMEVDENKHDDNDLQQKEEIDEPFIPPRHMYGPKLAIYYSNRGATLLHLGRYGECITDCSIAILYNPIYAKAYMRRCTAYEQIEKIDLSLSDAKMAYHIEPSNMATRKAVERLTKLEAERMEKLKVETMEKLKGLGNSLLSNFGLSLDNFNAVQDPKTGGYSISFNQNKK